MYTLLLTIVLSHASNGHSSMTTVTPISSLRQCVNAGKEWRESLAPNKYASYSFRCIKVRK